MTDSSRLYKENSINDSALEGRVCCSGPRLGVVGQAACGWLIAAQTSAPRRAMLMAAFVSAGNDLPHEMHLNVSRSGRLARSVCPQAEHCWDVYLGSTVTKATPAASALYARNVPS